MTVAGLTGNYGMGKSTVAGLFRELGARTIDTDAIVGELLAEEEVLAQIRDAFGEEVVKDGRIDKTALADAVFSRADLRIALENILHGRVFERVGEMLGRLSTEGCPVVIVEAPVLFERGYQNRFDAVITVYTSEEVALRRLEAKGIPRQEGLRRLRSQFPAETKALRSDWSIDNSGTVDETRRQVGRVYGELTALDRGKPGGSCHASN